MFEEEFEAITAFYIIDEENAFPFDEFELEDHICKKELVNFGTPEQKMRYVQINDAICRHTSQRTDLDLQPHLRPLPISGWPCK